MSRIYENSCKECNESFTAKAEKLLGYATANTWLILHTTGINNNQIVAHHVSEF